MVIPPTRRLHARLTPLVVFLVLVASVQGKGNLGYQLAPATFNQDEQTSLGLSALPAEHALIYQAATHEMKYSHHPHLGVFKDTLYAMWSNGPKGEDGPGQHVVYARSQDGLNWSETETLAPDPDGPQGPLRLTAGGWWVHDGRLIAYDTLFGGYNRRLGLKWNKEMLLEARVSDDGRHWSAPQVVLRDFMINEAPRPLPSGRLLMTGEDWQGTPRLPISDAGDGLTGWRDTFLPWPALTRMPNEATWFARPDGRPVMFFRDDNGSGRLYGALMDERQTSWTTPRRTDFPDAQSKARAGNLPGGGAYVLNNPSRFAGRRILTLTLSRDGVHFNRAFIVRNEAPPLFKANKRNSYGFQYPNSLVWRGYLYIIYSVNKADIMVTRVRLDQLR